MLLKTWSYKETVAKHFAQRILDAPEGERIAIAAALTPPEIAQIKNENTISSTTTIPALFAGCRYCFPRTLRLRPLQLEFVARPWCDPDFGANTHDTSLAGRRGLVKRH
jgi:hypothetical protein